MSSDRLSWDRVQEALREWRNLKAWKRDEAFGQVIVRDEAIAELVESGFSTEEAQASCATPGLRTAGEHRAESSRYPLPYAEDV